MDSGAFNCVVVWSMQACDVVLRRLQNKADENRAICVLMSPLSAGIQPSPAALRLRLQREPLGLYAEVLKARSGKTGTHWLSA